MIKEGADHKPVVLFTKYNMYVDKPVPVENFPPVRLIGVPSNQGITCYIQGAWDLDISAALVIAVGVTVEEALAGIGMNSRREVIHLECDFE